MASHPALLAWPAAASDEYGMALWSAPAVEAATGGHASTDFEASGVAFDSREVGEGDLFVALKGEHSDGHAYLDQAFARGAAAAIVDRAIDRPHVLVRDTSSALERLGIAARASDEVIVTDDYPRGEDPAAIRHAILAACSGATEIGDRRAAIAEAIRRAGRDDIVLIAGKGHEQGQIVGAGEGLRILPFDDVTVARECAVPTGE